MKYFCYVISLLALISLAHGYKILSLSPFGSNSHFAIGHSIAKSLLKEGNEITMISPYPLKKPLENYRDISIKDVMDKFEKENMMNAFDWGDMHPAFGILILYKMGNDLVHACLQHPDIKALMDSKEKFDVCIIESFNADALVGLADHFDCVLISYFTFGAVKWVNDMTSNQMSSAYVPHPFLSYTDKMTYSERLQNTAISLGEDVLYSLIHLPNQRRLYNKYFPNAKKSFDEMYRGSAIYFLNNHVSSSSPRPYLPNMIEIGGIHIEPVKSLPADMQKFLDSAHDGAILFSMGSIIKAVDWEADKKEAFIKVFGRLKQKVIWKYENETLLGKPDNVMIAPWIPQRDILAHPNIKVFMTHGGLLGTSEALNEGVPVLGFPVYGDQRMNMAKAVSRGYGLNINLEDITEETVLDSLKELLENEKYSQNAKIISERFRDRPLTPQETVVYWTNYAYKHKGAEHLRVGGRHLNFFSFYLIDVYLTLALFGLLFLTVTYVLLKCVFRLRKRNNIKKKRN